MANVPAATIALPTGSTPGTPSNTATAKSPANAKDTQLGISRRRMSLTAAISSNAVTAVASAASVPTIPWRNKAYGFVAADGVKVEIDVLTDLNIAFRFVPRA